MTPSVHFFSQPKTGTQRTENRPKHPAIVEDDSWEMLQTYAALDLLERGEMDATEMVETPYNALAHQVMAILFQKVSMPMTQSLQLNKTFPVWSAIADADLGR